MTKEQELRFKELSNINLSDIAPEEWKELMELNLI